VAFRQQGHGQGRPGEHKACRWENPGTKSGRSGGRRRTPPHGVRARFAPVPAPIVQCVGPRAARPNGPRNRVIIAPALVDGRRTRWVRCAISAPLTR
jgi:hypothetical protein